MIPSWGMPIIMLAKLVRGTAIANLKYYQMYTPVENSTKLTPSKGSKLEAKIEGGGVEAIKYQRNTYQLEFEMYCGNDDGSNRQLPFNHTDGVVDGEWVVLVQPENPAVEGARIDRCILSVEDSYDTQNGAKWKVVADILRPAEGNSVKWEVINKPTNLTLPVNYTGPDATNITLSGTATVAKNATIALNPTLTPSNATSPVIWSVDKPSVAVVDENGHVTGKSAGTAVVTATCNGKSASCTITVTA